jgi:hypothetical protein
MKSRPWAACLAGVVLGFVLSGSASPQLTGQEKAKPPAHLKWEYKHETELDAKSLNELGEQGWDIAAIILYGPEGRHFYLRRPKR